MPRSTLVLLALAAGALTGCGASTLDSPFADLVERDLGQNAERPSAAPVRAVAPGRTNHPLSIPDGATADDYARLALERSPAIRAARERVGRLRERIIQAHALDDPTLTLAPAGDMSETAAGQVRVMSSISQKIPAPGKRSARARVALREAEAAEQELRIEELRVSADARRASWSLYEFARAVAVTTEDRAVLARLRDAIEARVRAGLESQHASLRTNVELRTIDNSLTELRRRRDAAAAALNALLDRPPDAAIPDPAPAPVPEFDARLEDLLARADDASPELAKRRIEQARFRELRELARLNRTPDLTVSFTYNLVEDSGLSPVTTGQDQWWIGFGVNLPIWGGRLRAAEREATRGALEAAARLGETRNRVQFRVRDALLAIDSERAQAILLRDTITPEARRTLDSALAGYRTGAVGFLTLIDDWRRLIDLDLALERATARLNRAVATLDEAVGVTPSTDPAQVAPTLPGADDNHNQDPTR